MVVMCCLYPKGVAVGCSPCHLLVAAFVLCPPADFTPIPAPKEVPNLPPGLSALYLESAFLRLYL